MLSSVITVISTQHGSIILIYLTELFLRRNEILVAIRKRTCSLPSSMVAPWSPLGLEENNSGSQVTFSARKYFNFAGGRGGEREVVVDVLNKLTQFFEIGNGHY